MILNKVLYESSYPGKISPILKGKAGIYKLEFEDGSFYIGRSVNLHDRLSEHITKLKYSKHYNYKLQRKYYKYQKINLSVLFFLKDELNALDTFTKSELLARLEQVYFNTLNPDLQLTYELIYFHDVWAANRNKVINYSFISPAGSLFYGYNLCQFANKMGLDSAALSRVASGENTHHQGWTSNLENHLLYKQGKLATPESRRGYYLISPEGVEFTGTNVKEFCTEKGLSRRSTLRVVVGERNHHLGWTNSWENHIKVTKKVRLTHKDFGSADCFLYNITDSIKEKFNIKISGHYFMRKNVNSIQGWYITYLN